MFNPVCSVFKTFLSSEYSYFSVIEEEDLAELENKEEQDSDKIKIHE